MTGVNENIFRTQFSVFGDIDNIRVVAGSNCAFVKFTSREAAEGAFDRFSKHGVKAADNAYKVAWAKAKKK